MHSESVASQEYLRGWQDPSISLGVILAWKPKWLCGECEQTVFLCAQRGADSSRINDFPAPGSAEEVIKSESWAQRDLPNMNEEDSETTCVDQRADAHLAPDAPVTLCKPLGPRPSPGEGT